MKAAELGALEQAMAALARPGADPDAEPEPGPEPFKPATRGPQVGAHVWVHMCVLAFPPLRCPVTPSADSLTHSTPFGPLYTTLTRYSLFSAVTHYNCMLGRYSLR